MGVGEWARGAVLAAAVTAALALTVSGCGSGPPTPYDVVNTYLTDIAEGSYSGACTQLDAGTRDALIRRLGGRIGCAEVFERCLPSYALNLSKDQTQLFYSTILVTIHGHRSSVDVHGTAVARALQHLALREKRGTWRLTSWGATLDRCPRHPPDRRSRRHRRRATSL